MASFGVIIAKNNLLYTYVQSFAECEVMKVREIKHENFQIRCTECGRQKTLFTRATARESSLFLTYN